MDRDRIRFVGRRRLEELARNTSIQYLPPLRPEVLGNLKPLCNRLRCCSLSVVPHILVCELQRFFHKFQIQYNQSACACIIENSIAQLVFFTFVLEFFIDVVEFGALLKVLLNSVVVQGIVISAICFWVIIVMVGAIGVAAVAGAVGTQGGPGGPMRDPGRPMRTHAGQGGGPPPINHSRSRGANHAGSGWF